MQTRSLGRTGLRIGEITLGTWGLGAQSYGPVRPERFDETVREALARGVDAFDCAPVWGDAEARVGRLLREAKSDALVITRGGARLVDGKLQQSFDADALVRDCEASLERLGRDAIDVYLLHDPGDVTIRAGDWREGVERLERDGKIRAFGVSVGDAEEARLAVDAGAQVVCLPYNLLMPQTLEDVAGRVRDQGVGVLARSPLMYGLLAGRWTEARRFAEDDHRDRRWNRTSFQERIRQVGELEALVGPEHPDLATAALRFGLSHTAVSSVLVGARNPYQIGAAVDAASGPPYLSDADVILLAKLREAAAI
ncbi:MAG: aldo/keto reductase [Sandaracinaceae bacterium]|nr:aldo/keto reductase [Sandaracinaceae bacterium]